MLNERQEKILLSLKKFDYLAINQLQRICDLKSYNNAYRIISQLEPYVSVFKDNGINVYYLNKKGRESVNGNKVRKKITTANHYLLRNDLYIHLNKPPNWNNEVRMKYNSDNKEITIVADAHYSTNKHHLIEIDNMQKMKKNEIKIEKYRRLIEKGAFKGMPKLIWVTTTEYRKGTLQDLCDGLDCEIYLKGDLL